MMALSLTSATWAKLLLSMHTSRERGLAALTGGATVAAIDRLVHHSVVLELNVPSYRAEQAMKRKNKDK